MVSEYLYLEGLSYEAFKGNYLDCQPQETEPSKIVRKRCLLASLEQPKKPPKHPSTQANAPKNPPNPPTLSSCTFGDAKPREVLRVRRGPLKPKRKPDSGESPEECGVEVILTKILMNALSFCFGPSTEVPSPWGLLDSGEAGAGSRRKRRSKMPQDFVPAKQTKVFQVPKKQSGRPGVPPKCKRQAVLGVAFARQVAQEALLRWFCFCVLLQWLTTLKLLGNRRFSCEDEETKKG